jgi:WD40 repeat protein
VAIALASGASAEMAGHGGMVRALSISPDGGTVITGSFDYTARLWDFVEQNEIAALDEHGGPVNAVAFLPDGRRALSASDDRTVILWDVARRQPIRSFNGLAA